MTVIAFDVGGANLKAAWNGPTPGSAQRPFPLWKNPASLSRKMASMAWPAEPYDHLLLTMTGELCDCFPDKAAGVRHIVGAACQAAGPARVRVWSTYGRFMAPDEAVADPLPCAAANWHAQATCLAARWPGRDVILVDTGSTTTDILRLRHGRLAARGTTDMQRLSTGELVYVGAARTPLMALRSRVEIRHRTFRVMAEYFATLDDVRLYLGVAAPDPADTSTADGKPRTREHAAARIARMIGADAADLDPDDLEAIAMQFHDAAVTRIARAIGRAVRRARPDFVLLSGSGEALATQAVITTCPGLEQRRLADHIGTPLSTAACAWALLQLQ